MSASASESGYVDERIFGQVIDHFIAWLKAQNVPPPYLLILDGCSSHVSSVATLRKLIDAQVHALTMPAHTSSVLQPLDVGVFAPFKAFLRKATADIRLEGTRSQFLPKADMAEVACKAWETAASPSNVVAAFRSAGAWPVNRELADKLAKNGVLAASERFRRPTQGSFHRTPGMIRFGEDATKELNKSPHLAALNLSPVKKRMREPVPDSFKLAPLPPATKKARLINGENPSIPKMLTDGARLAALSELQDRREVEKDKKTNVAKAESVLRSHLVEKGFMEEDDRLTKAILHEFLKMQGCGVPITVSRESMFNDADKLVRTGRQLVHKYSIAPTAIASSSGSANADI